MRLLAFFFLFIPAGLLAQPFVTGLQKKLDDYYRAHLPLHGRIVTNQDEYAPGDTIFFSAMFVTAHDRLRIPGKSIASVALSDERDQKLVIARLALMEGKGISQVILPNDLPVGQYYLTAWTDRMGNDSGSFCRKRIAIGSQHAEVAELVAGVEGGKLIHGINSRIVVAALPFTSGHVKENGKTVLEFTTSGTGIASQYLTPAAGKVYEAVAGEKVVTLGEVSDDGISILLNPDNNRKFVRAYLVAPKESRYRKEIVHAVISSGARICQSSQISFNDQPFIVLEIPRDSLPGGIVRLTLFGADKDVIAERLFFNAAKDNTNAVVKLSRRTFGTREKVDLNLLVRSDPAPAKSTFTITVCQQRPEMKEKIPGDNLIDNLFISSGIADTKGIATAETLSSIDSKLILSAAGRFDRGMPPSSNVDPYFTPYLQFAGKAFDGVTGLPMPDSSKITFFLQKNINTYEARTRADGTFLLTMLFDFFGADEVFYRVENRNGEIEPNARVLVDETEIFREYQVSTEGEATPYAKFVRRRNFVNESYDYHKRARFEAKPEGISNSVEEEIFGADVTIKMTDYQLFPTMVETLREVIPFSQHRRIQGREVVRVYNDAAEKFRTTDPVYIIDGVMTDDTGYFLSLNPADIQTIKIVYTDEKLRFFGSIGRGGILIVDTKIPDNEKNVPRSVRAFAINGLTAPITRKDVIHGSSQPARVPDFRTNLLWVADAKTDTTGEFSTRFYTSDVPGVFKIYGEGLTADGKPFIFEETFEVIFGN